MEPTRVQFIAAAALRAHVRFEDLIEPVAKAFGDSTAGRAENGMLVLYPGHSHDAGDILVKTGTVQGHDVCVVKIAPWFRVNVEQGAPQGGLIAVLDAHTGRTLALIEDEHYLSDIRTAAAGALAARLLAPKVVERATVVGTGAQAYWQALALFHERPFRQLSIWGRDPDRVWRLADRLRSKLGSVAIDCESDLLAALADADVIITTTLAREPIVYGDMLRAGQHITAVGADDASKCELDFTVLQCARVFVDSRSSTAAHGDVARAISAGQYSIDLLAGEIGDLVLGRVTGRTSASDITVAKLVGIGAQDVAAAGVALRLLHQANQCIARNEPESSRGR
jgi:ornithine cyclodeaminase/alanine dehydrogenase-like protein (mu-crystallin family)